MSHMNFIYRACLLIGVIGVGLTFWLYSRFTVDDAFITWRYGENLVSNGVWGYNPTLFDLTQAYTNPIFAVLSLIPPFCGVNVVLFFKLVSLATLVIFSAWFLKVTNRSWIMLLLLLGAPATIIHAFGGLETLLFVALLSCLLVALDKNNISASIALTLLLFVTRPESWMLVVLVPVYFLINLPSPPKVLTIKALKNIVLGIQFKWKVFIAAGILLAIPLAVLFLFHKHYFGYALPNTFYAKSGAAISIQNLAKFIWFILPIFAFLLFGRVKLFLIMGVFFSALAIKYSISNLQMDYNARFAFHIFFPVYVFLVVLAANSNEKVSVYWEGLSGFTTSSNVVLKVFAGLYLFSFVSISGLVDAHMVTYYPRAVDSHAALGKTLKAIAAKYRLASFSFGDAGMAAYHSNLTALDNIGLGSAKVVHEGVTSELLDSYKIDLVVFHAQPEKISLDAFNQKTIVDWANKNNLFYLCDIYWQPDYTLKIYAKQKISEIEGLCASSKRLNDRSNREYLKATATIPPWKYWN